MNISNTYLDLEPVMERAAAAFGKVALVYHYDARGRACLLPCSLDADHGPRRLGGVIRNCRAKPAC